MNDYLAASKLRPQRGDEEILVMRPGFKQYAQGRQPYFPDTFATQDVKSLLKYNNVRPANPKARQRVERREEEEFLKSLNPSRR